MKKSSPIWIIAIIGIFVLITLNIVFQVKSTEYREKLSSINNSIISSEKTDTKQQCPDATGGFESSILHIKYFYSRFCPWCAKEEPILQKLVKETSIFIEWYNINDCPELAQKYEVSGVPTFVFSTTDNQTEYSHYGFIYEKDLLKLICDVGGC